MNFFIYENNKKYNIHIIRTGNKLFIDVFVVFSIQLSKSNAFKFVISAINLAIVDLPQPI